MPGQAAQPTSAASLRRDPESALPSPAERSEGSEASHGKCKSNEGTSLLHRRQPLAGWQWAVLSSFQFSYSFLNAGMGLFVLPIEAGRINGGNNTAIWVGVYLAIFGLSQLVSPIAGKFSDRMRSPYGRRRPCIVGGTMAAVASMVLMWAASITLAPRSYMLGLLLCQLSINVIFAAQSAIPADLEEESEDSGLPTSGQRGVVSGWVAFHSFAGSISAMICVITTGDASVAHAYPACIGILILTCVAVCWIISETPTDNQLPARPLSWEEVRGSYLIDLSKDMDFFWVCAGRLFYYMSTSASVFLYYYIRDMMDTPSDEETRQKLGQLTLGAQLMGLLFTIPASRASDYLGRKKVIYIACVFMIGTYALFMAAPKAGDNKWTLVLMAGLLYGAGNSAYLSVDYALALDCMPVSKTKAEAFGLWGVAGFIGSTLGPVIGGTLLALSTDPFRTGQLPGLSGAESYEYQGYATLMAIDGCAAASMVATLTSQITTVI